MNEITLYNDDCLQVMDKLIKQGIKVDVIITDPPYKLTSRGTKGSTMGGKFWKSELVNNGKVFECGYLTIDKWLDKCYEILNDKTQIYIMCNDKNLLEYLNAIDKSKFQFTKTLIWKKPNKICGQWYMTQKETIIFARKGKAKKINNTSDSDIIETPYFKKQKLLGGRKKNKYARYRKTYRNDGKIYK